LPDVPELVEQFKQILAPMVHDIEVPAGPASPKEDGARSESAAGWSDKDLLSVRDAALEVVSAVSTAGSYDVNPALQDLLAPILRQVDLPESLWARVAVAMNMVDQQRPFERPLMGGNRGVAVAERPAPVQRRMTPREHHDLIRSKLTLASRWWVQFAVKFGEQRVDHFITEIYREAGIKKLDDALPDQLKRAFEGALRRIRAFSERSGTPLPKWAQPGIDDD
jgi:hypothetical protein